MSGVRSAMPLFKAKQLCPEALIVPPDMAKYRTVSRAVRALYDKLTPDVEPLSLDEAFLDLTGTERLHHRSAAQSVAWLAREVQETIGVTVSIGLSYNKYLAKLASDLDKPNGFAVIGRAEARNFLSPRPVSDIWGVGKALERKLASEGISRIGQLQSRDKAELIARYGAMGSRLYHFARGEDDRRVERSEEHTSELQSRENLVCRLLLEKKKKKDKITSKIKKR